MQNLTNNESKTANADSIAAGEIFRSGFFKPVIDKCDGCERIIEFETERYCRTYAEPTAKWKIGICNFATHVKPEIITAQVKVNPLKAAKRASRKK